MSISANKRRKAAKAKRTDEVKSVSCKIRKGILPQFTLVKQEGSNQTRLERKSGAKKRPGVRLAKLTWRQISTLKLLTDK